MEDVLPDGENGTPAEEDFTGGSLTRSGVGNVVATTVVSYDRELLEEALRLLEIGAVTMGSVYSGRIQGAAGAVTKRPRVAGPLIE